MTWLESSAAVLHPLHLRHHRQAQGRAARHRRLRGGAGRVDEAHLLRQAGRDHFTTSDIGWVVGHSYIVYGPLIAGMTTILYEGVPIRPDAGIWWKIVAGPQGDGDVLVADRDPRAEEAGPGVPEEIRRLARCKHLFLAGEPLDEPTPRWIADALGKPVIDHYWQTETGWPILSSVPGVEETPIKFGSPSFPAYGYDLKLLREADGQEAGANEKGVVCIVPPLPPGCMTTVWGDDERFVKTYFAHFQGRAGLLHLRLGHPRRGRLLLHPRPHRRRDQRRRPPPRHARDRGGGAGAPQHRRSRRGRRGDEVKGQAAGFRGGQGREPHRDAGIAGAEEKEVMETVDKELGAIARPAGALRDGCRRRAPASCCAAPSRRSPKGAIRAI